MNETRAQTYAFINQNLELLSLLYDLDLMPEQHEENTPDEMRMCCVVGHFKHWKDELSTLRAQLQQAQAREAMLAEALNAIVKSLADQDDEGMIEHAQQIIDARTALSSPDTTSFLRRVRAEERNQAIAICDTINATTGRAADCAAAIRAMKDE